jgi:hypothetical protein
MSRKHPQNGATFSDPPPKKRRRGSAASPEQMKVAEADAAREAAVRRSQDKIIKKDGLFTLLFPDKVPPKPAPIKRRI